MNVFNPEYMYSNVITSDDIWLISMVLIGQLALLLSIMIFSAVRGAK